MKLTAPELAPGAGGGSLGLVAFMCATAVQRQACWYTPRMLQNLSKDIRECYRRVEECRRLAGTAMSELARFDYLEMEQRWLSLAHSYTSSARLTAFTGAKPRGRKRG